MPLIWKLRDQKHWSKGLNTYQLPSNLANLISCPDGAGRIGSTPSFLEIYGGIDVGSNQASVDAVDGEIPGQICRPTSWNGGANRDPAILDPIGFYPRNHR